MVVQPKDKVVPCLKKWRKLRCVEAFPDGSRAFFQNAGAPWWSRRNHVPMCSKWVVYGIVLPTSMTLRLRMIDWLIDWLGVWMTTPWHWLASKSETYIYFGLKCHPPFIVQTAHTVPWCLGGDFLSGITGCHRSGVRKLCREVPWRLFSLCWRIRWRGWNVSRAAAWLRELDRWLVTTGNSLLEQFETFGD